MNITVADVAIEVDVITVGSVQYVNTADAKNIIGTWKDQGPGRSWTAVGTTFLTVQTTPECEPQISEIRATDGDLYSLNALNLATDHALSWGEDVGEPTVEEQAIIRRELASRIEMGGMPTSPQALEALVFGIVVALGE